MFIEYVVLHTYDYGHIFVHDYVLYMLMLTLYYSMILYTLFLESVPLSFDLNSFEPG